MIMVKGLMDLSRPKGPECGHNGVKELALCLFVRPHLLPYSRHVNYAMQIGEVWRRYIHVLPDNHTFAPSKCSSHGNVLNRSAMCGTAAQGAHAHSCVWNIILALGTTRNLAAILGGF